MAINDNLTSFAAILAKLPQQKIAQAISALLLIYIAFIAAKITWLLVPQTVMSSDSPIVSTVNSVSSSGKGVNLSALQSLNLFGQYSEQEKEVIEEVVDAPETRLKLKLSGLVASDKPETAAAVIEHQGKQETYGVGDVILGTRASLEQVLIDRVIIKQSGRLETLMLDGADYNQPAQNIAHKKAAVKVKENTGNNSGESRVKSSVVDQRSNEALTRSVTKLRDDISNDPGKITDHLRISPARKGGKIAGYRLSPGKEPEFFKSSGLKAGDIAVQMNGFDLLSPLEAAQALSELKTERNISLLVERKSEFIEILFSID